MSAERGEKRIFTLDEAKRLLPKVKRLTEAAYQQLESILGTAEEVPDMGQLDQEVQEEVERVLSEWGESVMALGCEIKGLWLVDFDSGHGYYCWKHPEADLKYYHSYEEGFAGRMKIL